MPLFRRRDSAPAAPPATLPEPWPATPNAELGERVRVVPEESAIRDVLGRAQELACVAVLLPGPQRKAVTVHANSVRVGYIERDDAGRVRPTIDAVVASAGYCAVECVLLAGRNAELLLEPSNLPPMHEYRAYRALLSIFPDRQPDDEYDSARVHVVGFRTDERGVVLGTNMHEGSPADGIADLSRGLKRFRALGYECRRMTVDQCYDVRVTGYAPPGEIPEQAQ